MNLSRQIKLNAMITTQIETDYFVWYNPINSKYESGDIQKYETSSMFGASEELFPLILRFTKQSHHLADRVIRELNSAKESKG